MNKGLEPNIVLGALDSEMNKTAYSHASFFYVSNRGEVEIGYSISNPGWLLTAAWILT